MIIEILHRPLLNKERKKKLAKISNIITETEYVSYEWRCKYQNKDENLYDLQLFSLSITKNILEQHFFTNELGIISNNSIDKMNIKETLENIKFLMDDILKKKSKK